MATPDSPSSTTQEETALPDLIRLRAITILGLFDLFDHHLTFDERNRILIIYGPNGIGKTTILRMVVNLFESNFSYFRKVDFKSLMIELSDESTLEISKNMPGSLEESDEDDGLHEPASDLTLTLRVPGQESLELPAPQFQADRRPNFPLSELERFLPVRRVAARSWRDLRTSEVLSLAELVERYGDEFPPLRGSVQKPPELGSFLNKLPVHLIETQRLLSLPVRSSRTQAMGADEHTSTVIRFSQDLSARIQLELARSAQLSQRLDRSFPIRLLDQELPSSVTEEQIRHKYSVQGDYRGRLMEAGLLDSADEVALPERELGDIERRVLWAYLNDVDQKLGVFSPLLAKIELLRDIINSRFHFKLLFTDKIAGFRIETRQGSQISPDSLSSGEQHELVLAYQLLFIVQPGSLVLIDEPEISLHVSWQQKFLQDLERIAQTADLDFLIATHSPQIIHDRWELTESLTSENS